MYGHAYTPATISNMTKAVYQCKTSEEANKALADFIETYKDRYPNRRFEQAIETENQTERTVSQ